MRTAIITVLFPTMLFAQGERVGWIEQQVQEIDSDHTLVVDTIDATTIYDVDFDGGGVVYYGYRRKELVKIHQELGLSWGRSTKEYYFLNDTIMLLREREELFPWNADSTGYDHTGLFTNYEAKHYLWTWRIELQVSELGNPTWAGPPDEAEIDLMKLLLFRKRE